MDTRILAEDLVRIHGTARDRFELRERPGRVVALLQWGDALQLSEPDQAEDPRSRTVDVRYTDAESGERRAGVVRKRREGRAYAPLRFLPPDGRRPLSVSFVDLEHGDATLIRTPRGRHVLIDGGATVLIARLLAAAFPDTSPDEPLVLDALVATHGDASHYAGLAALAEARQHAVARKRLHVSVARYFHNGLVKLPERVADGRGRGTRKERERFGGAVERDGRHWITALWDDPRDAPLANAAFLRWGEALDRLLACPPGAPAAPGEELPVVRRLAAGDDAAFAGLAEDGLSLRAFGPRQESVDGAPALEVLCDADGDASATRTIEGHTIALQLVHGRARFLLGAPLDAAGGARLLASAREAAAPASLRSEVLHVHHHGGPEPCAELLAEIAPVVSIVTAGDETAAGERAHPRASLLAALGRASRSDRPLVYVAPLHAQHLWRGGVQPERFRETKRGRVVRKGRETQRGYFFAHERQRLGIVRVATDGERVLVAPLSASERPDDAYAFRIGPDGAIAADPVRVV